MLKFLWPLLILKLRNLGLTEEEQHALFKITQLNTECKYETQLHESETSQTNECFPVCFISLCLRIAVFLNATRRDKNLPPFASRENSGSMQFVETSERSSRSPRDLKFVRYSLG